MSNKEKFISILKSNVKREGIEKVIEMLEKSDFFTAPASTKYHDSEEGGLCSHSLNVYEELFKEAVNIENIESLTIVALLHDICKIGFYKISTRNTKDSTGKWIQVPYYEVDDQLPLGHGEKSVIMLLELISLTTEEIMAIRWHMGLSVSKDEYMYVSKAFENFPLAVYLNIADMKATFLNRNY